MTRCSFPLDWAAQWRSKALSGFLASAPLECLRIRGWLVSAETHPHTHNHTVEVCVYNRCCPAMQISPKQSGGCKVLVAPSLSMFRKPAQLFAPPSRGKHDNAKGCILKGVAGHCLMPKVTETACVNPSGATEYSFLCRRLDAL